MNPDRRAVADAGRGWPNYQEQEGPIMPERRRFGDAAVVVVMFTLGERGETSRACLLASVRASLDCSDKPAKNAIQSLCEEGRIESRRASRGRHVYRIKETP